MYKEKQAVRGCRLGQEAVGWLEAGRVFVSPRALRQEEHPRAAQEDDTHPCCHGYCGARGLAGTNGLLQTGSATEGKAKPSQTSRLSTATDIYTQVLGAGNASEPHWQTAKHPCQHHLPCKNDSWDIGLLHSFVLNLFRLSSVYADWLLLQ